MLQMRLKAVYNSITYPLFYGYVEAFNQDYPGYGADSVCEIVVIDGFSVLANARLADSAWEFEAAIIGPAAWYPLGEQYGDVMGDQSRNGKHGTYSAPITNAQQGILPYSGSGRALQFDGIDDYGTAPISALTNNGTFSVACWVQMPDEIPTDLPTTIIRQDPGSVAVLASNTDQMWHLGITTTGYLFVEGLTNYPVAGAQWSNEPLVAGRTYFITFIFDTTADVTVLYLDGVAQSNPQAYTLGWTSTVRGALIVGGIATATEHPFKGIMDEVLTFDYEVSAPIIEGLYEAGTNPWFGEDPATRCGSVLDNATWPGPLRDLDTGDSVLGAATLGGDVLSYLQNVAVTEDGWLFVTADGMVRLVGRANRLTESAYNTSDATYGDGGGSELSFHAITVEPSNVQQIVNHVTVSRQGGLDQESSDSTSQTSYGNRFRSLSGLLMSTDSQAADRAAVEVFRHKDPGFRVNGLTIKPRRNPTVLFPKILNYDIGQRITVARRPMDVGSVISKEVHIHGIQHDLDASAHSWTTVWSTVPVDPNEDAWALVGAANVGQSDAHVAY